MASIHSHHDQNYENPLLMLSDRKFLYFLAGLGAVTLFICCYGLLDSVYLSYNRRAPTWYLWHNSKQSPTYQSQNIQCSVTARLHTLSGTERRRMQNLYDQHLQSEILRLREVILTTLLSINRTPSVVEDNESCHSQGDVDSVTIRVQYEDANSFAVTERTAVTAFESGTERRAYSRLSNNNHSNATSPDTSYNFTGPMQASLYLSAGTEDALSPFLSLDRSDYGTPHSSHPGVEQTAGAVDAVWALADSVMHSDLVASTVNGWMEQLALNEDDGESPGQGKGSTGLASADATLKNNNDPNGDASV